LLLDTVIIPQLLIFGVLAYLGGIDQGLAAVQILAIVVVDNIKRTLRVCAIVYWRTPVDLKPTQAAVLVEGRLLGQLGLD
jgi:hypothetical protein